MQQFANLNQIQPGSTAVAGNNRAAGGGCLQRNNSKMFILRSVYQDSTQVKEERLGGVGDRRHEENTVLDVELYSKSVQFLQVLAVLSRNR